MLDKKWCCYQRVSGQFLDVMDLLRVPSSLGAGFRVPTPLGDESA